MATADETDEPDRPTEETATQATMAPGPGRMVRRDSPQVSDLAWSSARGEFRIDCQRGRRTVLEARMTSLPQDLRYEWRVITGDANETESLATLGGMTADLVEGEGLPDGFEPIDGAATVRFTFAKPPPYPLGLNVLGVHRFSSFVIATPWRTCP